MFEPLPIQRPSLTRRLGDPAEDPAKITATSVQPNETSAASRPLINRTLSPIGAPATAPAESAQLAPRPQISRMPVTAGTPTIVRPDTWKPTLNSGDDKVTGAPMYDNASIDRLAARRPIPQPAPQVGNTRIPARSLIQRPQAASTAGQSVLTMPDDNQPLLRRPQVAVRGAGEMAEYYNANADREARQKLASDLDSQRFRLEMIAGNPGRRGRAALEALDQNTQQRAALVAGGERLSAESQQNRANRANVLANTGLEQAGADRRAELAATGADADRSQQLAIASMDDVTRRAAQDKAETLTGADGRIWRVGADGTARPVADAEGKQIAGAQPRDPNALTQGQVLDSLGSELKAATDQLTAMQGINGTATPEQLQAQQAYVQNLQQQLQGARGGTGQQQRTKPSWEQFQARAKAQGSRMTPEQLRAHYDQMQ